MRRIPLIRSVMTPFPHSIGSDRTLGEARRMMVEHRIGHLPVIQEGRLVGVLTERDVQVRAGDEDEFLVRDRCTMEVYVVKPTERLDRVLTHMAEKQIGSALVVKEDRLVGIFTTTDACRCFAELLHTLFPGGGDEAA
jgi:acetoin utilization protein AcuB